MNKYIKLALKIVGGIVAVFITLAIVLIVFVDPNDYKQEIANLVKSKTGYSVNIRGNIALSVFPWIGVQVNDVEVENPPGYKGKTLARVARVDISAKLFALLRSKLEMKHITVRGLTLNLQRNRAGRANWEGKKATKEKDKSGSNVQLNISGVSITEADIAYHDAKTGEAFSIKKLNLTMGNIGSGKSESLSLSLIYQAGKNKPVKSCYL